jgi:hypothetical protein
MKRASGSSILLRARRGDFKEEITMKAIMCLGVLAMLVGCDGSKLELESAKTNLANVTRERDDLKTQVATLEGELTGLRTALAKEKTAEAQSVEKNNKAPMGSKSSSGETSPSPQNKHAHKS